MDQRFDKVAPGREIGGTRTQGKLAAKDLVQAFGMKRRRNLVDRIGIHGRDSSPGITASGGTLVKSAILRRSPSGKGLSARQSTTSGWMPISRSSLTEYCVGLVFISPAVAMNGTSVRWM